MTAADGRPRPPAEPPAWPLLAILAVLALAVALGWAHVVYGDWRCAFAQCRRWT